MLSTLSYLFSKPLKAKVEGSNLFGTKVLLYSERLANASSMTCHANFLVALSDAGKEETL